MTVARPSMEFVADLTRRAGARALEMLAGLRAEVKPDATLVTDADRVLEVMIYDTLAAEAPGYSFLGEEFGFRGGDPANGWVVDPIDGTTNLVHGIPFWGVAIGLLESGVPTLGVLHLPLLGETFAAAAGQGAWLNGLRIHARDQGPLEQESILAATGESFRDLDFAGTLGRLRCFGSIASNLAYTAAGRHAACISHGDKLTDLVAPLCITQESGCQSAWLSGEPFGVLDYERPERRGLPVVVAPPLTMAHLLRTVRLRQSSALIVDNRDEGSRER